MSKESMRIGYMAGREIPVPEIARQVKRSAADIRAALLIAGITLPRDRGPVVLVTVPIESCIDDIDVVGRRYRMSRDQVAHAVLISVLRGDVARIEDALERGGLTHD